MKDNKLNILITKDQSCKHDLRLVLSTQVRIPPVFDVFHGTSADVWKWSPGRLVRMGWFVLKASCRLSHKILGKFAKDASQISRSPTWLILSVKVWRWLFMTLWFVQVLLGDWIVFDCRLWKGTLRLKGFLQPSMVAWFRSRVYVEKEPPNRPRWRGVKKCPLMSTFLPVGHLGHREPFLRRWVVETRNHQRIKRVFGHQLDDSKSIIKTGCFTIALEKATFAKLVSQRFSAMPTQCWAFTSTKKRT